MSKAITNSFKATHLSRNLRLTLQPIKFCYSKNTLKFTKYKLCQPPFITSNIVYPLRFQQLFQPSSEWSFLGSLATKISSYFKWFRISKELKVPFHQISKRCKKISKLLFTRRFSPYINKFPTITYLYHFSRTRTIFHGHIGMLCVISIIPFSLHMNHPSAAYLTCKSLELYFYFWDRFLTIRSFALLSYLNYIH